MTSLSAVATEAEALHILQTEFQYDFTFHLNPCHEATEGKSSNDDTGDDQNRIAIESNHTNHRNESSLDDRIQTSIRLMQNVIHVLHRVATTAAAAAAKVVQVASTAEETVVSHHIEIIEVHDNDDGTTTSTYVSNTSPPQSTSHPNLRDVYTMHHCGMSSDIRFIRYSKFVGLIPSITTNSSQ
jgi:hypothetical protein